MLARRRLPNVILKTPISYHGMYLLDILHRYAIYLAFLEDVSRKGKLSCHERVTPMSLVTQRKGLCSFVGGHEEWLFGRRTLNKRQFHSRSYSNGTTRVPPTPWAVRAELRTHFGGATESPIPSILVILAPQAKFN